MRLLQLFTVCFRQAIDKLLQPNRIAVGTAVPGLVKDSIAQAKIGRKVNDAFCQTGELFDLLRGTAVRQRQEQQIAGF